MSPTVATVYSVTVTDQNGCPGNMASKTVNVVNVVGGNKGQQILVCHKGNTLAIGAGGIPDHLGHGDMLGSCTDDARTVTDALSIRVLSNPSSNYFELQVNAKAGSNMQLSVYDLQGRVVETKAAVQSNQTLRLGTSYYPGVYLVQIKQGTQTQTIRLIKSN